MDPEKEKLENFIKELIELGEDERELKFWQEIFDDLEEEEKQKLLDNLEEELEKLKKIK